MTYDEKYCDTHNQPYADYLNGCPICAGEKLKGSMIVRINAPEEKPKDDGGLVIGEAHEAFF